MLDRSGGHRRDLAARQAMAAPRSLSRRVAVAVRSVAGVRGLRARVRAILAAREVGARPRDATSRAGRIDRLVTLRPARLDGVERPRARKRHPLRRPRRRLPPGHGRRAGLARREAHDVPARRHRRPRPPIVGCAALGAPALVVDERIRARWAWPSLVGVRDPRVPRLRRHPRWRPHAPPRARRRSDRVAPRGVRDRRAERPRPQDRRRAPVARGMLGQRILPRPRSRGPRRSPHELGATTPRPSDAELARAADRPRASRSDAHRPPTSASRRARTSISRSSPRLPPPSAPTSPPRPTSP